LKDPVRNKEVAATPEEQVRQAIILYLHNSRNIPKGLMSVEKSILQQGEQKRADLVVYDRKGAPWMVVECKAPTVSISQSTLEQVANYNRKFRAPYVLVTNGIEHFCVHIQEDEMTFLNEMPNWE
jgi:type I site-specific restriction endonuclease